MNHQTVHLNRKKRALASVLVALAIVGIALAVGIPQAAAQPADAPAGTLFLPFRRLTAENFSDAVAVGDFNHDGRKDAAMTTLDTLDIFLQQPDGTLAAPVTYANGAFIDQVQLSRTATVKAPGKPKLKSPAQGSAITTQRPELTWSSAARAVEYRLHLYQDSASGPEVQGKAGIKTTHFKTKKLAKGKTYYWVIEGCNSTACTPSNGGTFTIAP